MNDASGRDGDVRLGVARSLPDVLLSGVLVLENGLLARASGVPDRLGRDRRLRHVGEPAGGALDLDPVADRHVRRQGRDGDVAVDVRLGHAPQGLLLRDLRVLDLQLRRRPLGDVPRSLVGGADGLLVSLSPSCVGRVPVRPFGHVAEFGVPVVEDRLLAPRAGVPDVLRGLAGLGGRVEPIGLQLVPHAIADAEPGLEHLLVVVARDGGGLHAPQRLGDLRRLHLLLGDRPLDRDPERAVLVLGLLDLDEDPRLAVFARLRQGHGIPGVVPERLSALPSVDVVVDGRVDGLVLVALDHGLVGDLGLRHALDDGVVERAVVVAADLLDRVGDALLRGVRELLDLRAVPHPLRLDRLGARVGRDTVERVGLVRHLYEVLHKRVRALRVPSDLLLVVAPPLRQRGTVLALEPEAIVDDVLVRGLRDEVPDGVMHLCPRDSLQEPAYADRDLLSVLRRPVGVGAHALLQDLEAPGAGHSVTGRGTVDPVLRKL